MMITISPLENTLYIQHLKKFFSAYHIVHTIWTAASDTFGEHKRIRLNIPAILRCMSSQKKILVLDRVWKGWKSCLTFTAIHRTAGEIFPLNSPAATQKEIKMLCCSKVEDLNPSQICVSLLSLFPYFLFHKSIVNGNELEGKPL